jgi:plasmid stabilization system protein ParE
MTLRVTTTNAADADIRDIATYIALDNRNAAAQFGDELFKAFAMIAEHPQMGAPITDFRLPLRRIRVSRRFRRYPIYFHRPRSKSCGCCMARAMSQR